MKQLFLKLFMIYAIVNTYKFIDCNRSRNGVFQILNRQNIIPVDSYGYEIFQMQNRYYKEQRCKVDDAFYPNMVKNELQIMQEFDNEYYIQSLYQNDNPKCQYANIMTELLKIDTENGKRQERPALIYQDKKVIHWLQNIDQQVQGPLAQKVYKTFFTQIEPFMSTLLKTHNQPIFKNLCWKFDIVHQILLFVQRFKEQRTDDQGTYTYHHKNLNLHTLLLQDPFSVVISNFLGATKFYGTNPIFKNRMHNNENFIKPEINDLNILAKNISQQQLDPQTKKSELKKLQDKIDELYHSNDEYSLGVIISYILLEQEIEYQKPQNMFQHKGKNNFQKIQQLYQRDNYKFYIAQFVNRLLNGNIGYSDYMSQYEIIQRHVRSKINDQNQCNCQIYFQQVLYYYKIKGLAIDSEKMQDLRKRAEIFLTDQELSDPNQWYNASFQIAVNNPSIPQYDQNIIKNIDSQFDANFYQVDLENFSGQDLNEEQPKKSQSISQMIFSKIGSGFFI